MFRATGKGEVEIDMEVSTPGFMKALLYNFDFDDFAGYQYRPLKEAHAHFLGEQVVPLLENDSGTIWMQGSASRIGTAGWNKTLSQTRVGRVAGFLMSNGVNGDQIQSDAVGAELAMNHALDDERDRSVLIYAMPKKHEDPVPPPRIVPPKPKLSANFKLSMITGLSVSQALRFAKLLKFKIGAGVAVDANFFMVWDTTNSLACIYVYVGVGLGFGAKDLPKVSGTTHGPWNSFTTEKAISSAQFGRWARFTTIGVLSESLNWITIETPKGVDNVYERIDTGTTLGGGASSTVGDFIRLQGPSPFHGP
jgi:hypothetical protein